MVSPFDFRKIGAVLFFFHRLDVPSSKPLRDSFRCSAEPCRRHGFMDGVGVCGLQSDHCASSNSPCSIGRYECIGVGLNEVPLQLRRQLDHSPAFVGITESGENLPAHAKVGVVHVAAFLDFGQAQSHARN